MVAKLAFVQFKSDRVYAVVNIDDIEEFYPKHCDDFRKDKVYTVKWPFLSDSNKSSSNDYHEAVILCLGANDGEIVRKAKSLKKFNKLPRSFLDKFERNEANKSKKKEPTKGETSKKLKERETRREEVARKRMKLSESKDNSSKDIEEIEDSEETDLIFNDKSPKKDLQKGLDALLQQAEELHTSSKKDSFSFSTPSKLLNKPQEVRQSPLHPEFKVQELAQETKRQLFNENKRGKRNFSDESDTDDTTTSYTPSEVKMHNYEEQVNSLRVDVMQLRKKIKTLEDKCKESDVLISDLKELNLNLQRKLLKGEAQASPRKAFNAGEARASPRKAFNASVSLIPSEQLSSGIKSPQLKPAKHSEDFLASNKASPAKDRSVLERSTFAEPQSPISKSQSHKSPRQTKDFKSKEDISKALYEAIMNPNAMELREDSDGMIHLGNGVWIPKELFTTKLSKLSVKNSIAVADLMEAIWPSGALATRSYDGGISPKNPNAPRKSAATPAKREVCLGFYRARKMAEGLKEEKALDMSVELEGKKIMRDKFSRSGKAAKKKLTAGTSD